jgi:hypothetical protein
LPKANTVEKTVNVPVKPTLSNHESLSEDTVAEK